MVDQRCGTCIWWADKDNEHDKDAAVISRCLYPLPYWIDVHYSHPNEGTHCHTWQPSAQGSLARREDDT